MPTIDTCRLCREKRNLVDGHEVPKFFFRRMKKEGGGLLRRPVAPNKPLQDGFKLPLLCEECEAKFSRRETRFANDFFHPWMDRRENPEVYNSDTHYFLVSLLWRGLILYLQKKPPEAQRWLATLCELEEDWREFLSEEKERPERDQIHMFIADIAISRRQPIVNLNRYMVDTVDATVAVSETKCWVYAKMGMFVIVGGVEGLSEDQWKNTRIFADGGVFRTPQKILDPEFGAFITDRARVSHELYQERISDRQRERALDRVLENPDQFVEGLLGQAYEADLNAVVDPVIGRSTKIDRNEKCPCGSGKKYKRCHGSSGTSNTT